MLEWNVYVGDFNGKRIETDNVFDHAGFVRDCQETYKKHKDDKGAFLEAVRRSLMYYFWSKCEWEIIISHWPPRKDAQDLKIDVYDQVMLNWPIFSEYVWNNRDEFKVRRKRNVKA
jgi:hypothetical protein